MASDDYADGGVHELTQGGGELRTVLDAAARRGQLVVLDFSAKWCGPCKMIFPVLQRMAQEYRGRVAFVKVDCEATPANRGLAQESGVAAFPTFHLYAASARVAELRGANPPALRAAVESALARLPPAASGAGPAAGSAQPPPPMAAALAAALSRLKAQVPYADFVAAARALLGCVANVLDKPDEARYRRVRLSNAAFHAKLGSKPGGLESMRVLGFVEREEGGERVLVLDEVSPELRSVRTLLERAVPGGADSAAAAPPAVALPAAGDSSGSSAQPATPAATPALTGGGGAPAAAQLDAAALTAALAQSMALGGAGPAGGAVARAPAAPGAYGQVRVTPRMMARCLAKIMREAGLVAPQPPGPPRAPP